MCEDLLRQAVQLEAVWHHVSIHTRHDAKLCCRLGQALKQQRVEGTALTVQDHIDGGRVVVRLLIAALAHERIVYIRDRHDLSGDRDLLAHQPVRVAMAVPALVVPAADLQRIAVQRLVLAVLHLLQDLCTRGGVRLHDFKLFLRELPRFVEDLLRNRDFSDVVEGGRSLDQRDVLLREIIGLRLLHELMQQHLGDAADVPDMVTTLVVSDLDDVTEDAHHEGVVLLFLRDLVGYETHQALLIDVEIQRILYAPTHDVDIERTRDVVGDAERIGVLHRLHRLLRGDHDHRDLLNPVVAVHLLEHLEAVHLRHIDVEQYQIDGDVFLQDPKCLAPIRGLDVIVLIAEHVAQHHAIHLRIVHDEYCLTFHEISLVDLTQRCYGLLVLCDHLLVQRLVAIHAAAAQELRELDRRLRERGEAECQAEALQRMGRAECILDLAGLQCCGQLLHALIVQELQRELLHQRGVRDAV